VPAIAGGVVLGADLGQNSPSVEGVDFFCLGKKKDGLVFGAELGQNSPSAEGVDFFISDSL